MTQVTLDRNFNHQEAETRLYKFWEDSGFFKADPEASGDPFVIVIPPPNVTGNLHMGHALDETLQDILVRYHRMCGDNTLWLPGTDHAGIATQNVVEKALAAEGSSREDLGREKFVERVWQWKEQYGSNIVHQLRRLGASCDWSRERFTMDEGLSKAVREVFVSLYEQGLIYRGHYIINWCPRCHTALADLEVEHEDRKGQLYYLQYPVVGSSGEFLTVATTRPETIFGDTAVAVNPEDERFKHLVGKEVEVPLIGRKVPVIADSYVDIAFGTGALKVTPAHDTNDFRLGQTHNLPSIKAIDDDGRLNQEAGAYAGEDRFEARQKMVPELEEKGFLLKIEPINHALGTCYRCKTVVEPNLSQQWFVRAEPLAKRAAEAVREDRTKFVPKNWEKTYFEWMDNIRDWCISRQLWWGHQIPAWHCAKCGETVVSREDPSTCSCGGNLERDPDVLDTWFSSALWPFSTLGWPDKTPDLARYYPTTCLVTGFDIIFFWVARMMMMGLHFMDEVPFKTVIIHALVKDADGKKMSKSKGNVVDPLMIIDRYGADAFRFTLCAMAGHGRDIRLSDDRIAGYGKFVNKLWNAAKLVLTNAGEHTSCSLASAPVPQNLPDRWLRSRLNQVTAEVREHLDQFYYDRIADTLYHFVWDEFCDWYLELIKPVLYGTDEAAKASTQANMICILGELLKLLHPVMPFVTEELWSKLPGSQGSIMKANFPSVNPAVHDGEAESTIRFLMDVTKAVRSVRSDFGVAPGVKLEPLVKVGDLSLASALNEYSPLLLKLMGAEAILLASGAQSKPKDASLTAFPWGEVWVPLAGHIDFAAETQRLTKELATVEKDCRAAQNKLANEDYIAKAPEEIVAETRERLVALEVRAVTLKESLTRLKEMNG